jgi:ribosome-associated protein
LRLLDLVFQPTSNPSTTLTAWLRFLRLFCYTSGMIKIGDKVEIDQGEIQFEYSRAAGPGGQNVNKVSSAVQLRYNARDSVALPEDVKMRLRRLAGRRMTADGVLVINARQYRTQEQNRQAALTRFRHLVQLALEPPKPRHKTKPTRASILRRLETKRKRADIKRSRQGKGTEE